MHIMVTWELKGSAEQLDSAARALGAIVGDRAIRTTAAVVASFDDEQDARAKALQEAAPALREQFPSLHWHVRRRAIHTRPELDAFPLVEIYVPDGEQAIAPDTLQGGERCPQCGLRARRRIATPEVRLVSKKLPAHPLLAILQYTAVRRSAWAALADLAAPAVHLRPVLVDGRPSEEWVAVEAIRNLGRMAGDVVFGPPCPACGLRRVIENNNLMPVYRQGDWSGEAWARAEDSLAILGTPALLQRIEEILSPADVGAKPIELLPPRA
jgi:hypothetical protein